MTRLLLASITVVSALALVPYAVKAQKWTPTKGALPKSNQVYVKIILPTDPATRDKDRPVVESWIAEQLKKRGQSKFTAATEWVPLAGKWDEPGSREIAAVVQAKTEQGLPYVAILIGPPASQVASKR
jgi:hypothetical protein